YSILSVVSILQFCLILALRSFPTRRSSDLCALAILLGFVYLVVTKTISPAIPLTYVGSMFVFYLIATRSLHESLVEVLSGGLLFGAVFMATDYEIGRAHV